MRRRQHTPTPRCRYATKLSACVGRQWQLKDVHRKVLHCYRQVAPLCMAYAVLSRSYWRRAAGPRRNFARSRAPPPWQCQEGASSLLHPRVHPTIARVHKGATACGRWFKWPQDPGSTGTKWIGTRSGRCDTGSPAIWRVNPPRPSGRRSPGRLDEWSATTVPRQQRGDLHASQKASPSTRTCPAAIGSSSSTGPRPVIDNSLRDRGAACPCV